MIRLALLSALFVPSALAADEGDALPAPPIVFVRSYDSAAEDAKPAGEQLGFIVESQGMILTGYEALRDPESKVLRHTLKVQRIGKDEALPASIVSVEPTLGFAILKVETDEELPSSVFCSRDEIKVGDRVRSLDKVVDGKPVYVVGEISDLNSMECYQSSMTATMLRARIAIPDRSIGGPVFNDKGAIVAIYTGHKPTDELELPPGGAVEELHEEAEASNEGKQHILPIFLVSTIYENLKLRKSLKSPWTGFSVRPLTDEEKELFPHKRYRSAIGIDEIWKGGPAEKLGIRAGDLLVAFSYYNTNTVAEFQRWLYAHGVGMDVKLYFLRGGKELRTVDYTIEERPQWAVPR